MLSPSLLHEDPATLSHEQLDDALTELCAHLNAAEFRLLELVGECEARGREGSLGVKSTAHWLNYKCGIDLGAAREKVRVAKALRDLPLLRKAFAAGTVSYSKVRAVTRVATPDNEGLLLGYAQAATASQIEKIVRGYRRADRLNDPEAVLRQHRERGLRWWVDEDGMLVLHGRFPPEEGALILRALEAVQQRRYREERAGESEDRITRAHGQLDPEAVSPVAARRGDALLQLLEAGAAHDPAAIPGGERTLIVVHVQTGSDESSSSSRPSSGTRPAPPALPELEHGPVIAPETARRLACDASVVAQAEGPDGTVLSIGRRSRSVPPWMHRALRRRDGGCRFPGCTQTHHVDAHHVHHWADGGETSLDNLVLLCRYHHRLVHESGFRCEATEDGDFRFLTPSGFALPEAFPQKPGAWEAVTQLNAQRGLAITPRTCDGGWDGVPVDYGEAVAQVWRATKGTWGVPVAEVPMPPPRFRGNVEGSVPAESEPEDEDDGLWWPVVNGKVVRFDDSRSRG